MLLPTSSPPASRCLPNRYELQSSELRAPAGVSGPIVGALAHDEVDPQAPGLWRPQYLHLERDRWSFGRGEGRGSAGGESFKFEMRCEKKSCNEYGKLLYTYKNIYCVIQWKSSCYNKFFNSHGMQYDKNALVDATRTTFTDPPGSGQLAITM